MGICTCGSREAGYCLARVIPGQQERKCRAFRPGITEKPDARPGGRILLSCSELSSETANRARHSHKMLCVQAGYRRKARLHTALTMPHGFVCRILSDTPGSLSVRRRTARRGMQWKAHGSGRRCQAIHRLPRTTMQITSDAAQPSVPASGFALRV